MAVRGSGEQGTFVGRVCRGRRHGANAECAARVVVWGGTGHKEIYWHRVPMSHTSQEELLLHSAPAVSS